MLEILKNKLNIEVGTVIMLLILSGIVLLYNLNQAPVQSWDEGYYANIAHELNFPSLKPTLHGEPWLEKPPLGIWLINLSFKIIGTNAWGLRLPAAMFAIGSILLLYFLGKQLFSLTTGLAAGTAFLLSSIFLHHYHLARTGDLDTMWLFSSLGAILFYVLAWRKSRWLMMSGLFLGLGFMLRGSPLLITLLIIILHALLTKIYKKINWQWWLISLIIMLAILLPWHIVMFVDYGRDFWSVYLDQGLLNRIINPIDNHSGSLLYYHDFLINRFGLLTKISYLSVIGLIYTGFKQHHKESLLLGLYATVYLISISVMATKVFWYIMPVAPILILSTISSARYMIINQKDIIIKLLASLIAVLWLANIPANPGHWDFTTRLLVLVIIVAGGGWLWQKQSPFLIKQQFKVGFIYVALLTLLFINTTEVGLKTAFQPKPLLAIAQIAQQLKGNYEAKKILVTAPELSWIKGWLNPQAEWYLNTTNQLNARYVELPQALMLLKQIDGGWLIANTNQATYLTTQTNLKSQIIYKNQDLLLIKIP